MTGKRQVDDGEMSRVSLDEVAQESHPVPIISEFVSAILNYTTIYYADNVASATLFMACSVYHSVVHSGCATFITKSAHFCTFFVYIFGNVIFFL